MVLIGNASPKILKSLFSLTNSSIPEITAGQLEYVLLVAIVGEIIRLYLDRELLHKGTRVAGLCVRVRVPSLLFRRQCTLGQQTLNPARQVTADVIDLARVSGQGDKGRPQTMHK